MVIITSGQGGRETHLCNQNRRERIERRRYLKNYITKCSQQDRDIGFIYWYKRRQTQS